MIAAANTVMLAEVLAMPDALAVIVVLPDATPVTGTRTLVTPAPTETLAGTVATEGLLELRLIVRADVGAEDNSRVRFCVAGALMLRLVGEKLIVIGGLVTWMD